jgi:hypothetical protein
MVVGVSRGHSGRTLGRPFGRRTGLQLDQSRLGVAPRGVGGGDTFACPPCLARGLDRPVEVATGLSQRGGPLAGSPCLVASLLTLALNTVALGLFTLRRGSQSGSELLDRVLRLGLGGLSSSPAGHDRQSARPPAPVASRPHADVPSRCWSRSWAASSTDLCLHSAARYTQAMRPLRWTRRRSPNTKA